MEFLEAQAVAHDGGGRPLAARPDGYRLRATRTGRSAGPCVMVAVSPRGTVFLSPAVRNQKMGTDLLRSGDGGRSFELVETPRPYRGTPPGYRLRIVNLLPQYFRWLSKRLPNGCTMHPFLHRDSVTGRLFASTMMKGACEDGSGSVLAMSDDDGETWTYSRVGMGSWDWGKVFTGPPATAASRAALAQSGHSNLVYFAATGPTLITGPNQLTYKSIDGGATFVRVSDTFPAKQAARLRAGYPQSGVVASDGAIYRPWAGTPLDFVPTFPKRKMRVHVVRSSNEGQSWEHFEVPDSRSSLLEPTIAIDAEDTLYLAWADPSTGGIQLTMSTDRAVSWSPPISLTPPGTRRVAKVAISVRAPGDIALAYWGSVQSRGFGDGWVFPDGRPYSGYLTLCRDLKASNPVFWTCAVNPPDRVLLPRGESALASGEYLGPPAFAPDGSVWAGFVSLGRPRDSVVARLSAFSAAPGELEEVAS
jgi:hypothetical protein